MLDTILNNLNSIRNEMVIISKRQYGWGWFGDRATVNATLRGYVRSNALTAADYKEIAGEGYAEETNS